ncbi:MAG: hypothetical protein ABGY24_10280 [bacterium]
MMRYVLDPIGRCDGGGRGARGAGENQISSSVFSRRIWAEQREMRVAGALLF